MQLADLSLPHHIRPNRSAQERPPLLLLLHGFGSNEDDLFALAEQIDGRFFVVSARAPVEIGPHAYGWFPLLINQQGIRIDPDQVEESRQLLSQFLDELVAAYALATDQCFLLGFSQGAMMSMALLLTQPQKIAGVIALSGLLLPVPEAEAAPEEALTDKPIFWGHGLHDNVLPIQFGRQAQAQLSELPVTLTYREYPVVHTIGPAEWQDVQQWLQTELAVL